MNDITCSSGPVSSMPGSQHRVPAGTMCEDHPDRPAVTRIQGETDSFGAEYICMCQECLDAHIEYRNAQLLVNKFCDWCKSVSTNVKPFRDMDEGMSGPVYQVCLACRAQSYNEADDEEEYIRRLR